MEKAEECRDSCGWRTYEKRRGTILMSIQLNMDIPGNCQNVES